MIKSLIGIPAIYFGVIYFGVLFTLSILFGTSSNTALLITFGCGYPLVVTFIVAFISEAVREEEEMDFSSWEEYVPSLKVCIFDVIEEKVIPLLNGTRDRSWVNWNELPVCENSIEHKYPLDLLGYLVSCVLRTHLASPYILDHTGITYVSEDGFEIRRFE